MLFALLTLDDVELAWGLGHTLDLQDPYAWSDLVDAYEKVDPLATLPVHTRLVELALVDADARSYRVAARRLARMRALAADTDQAPDVDAFIADLRETHRRRPSAAARTRRSRVAVSAGDFRQLMPDRRCDRSGTGDQMN